MAIAGPFALLPCRYKRSPQRGVRVQAGWSAIQVTDHLATATRCGGRDKDKRVCTLCAGSHEDDVCTLAKDRSTPKATNRAPPLRSLRRMRSYLIPSLPTSFCGTPTGTIKVAFHMIMVLYFEHTRMLRFAKLRC
jgi:hypothetical protein